MYDTILIPTDGSAGANAAARHGVSLARAFDSQVHFLSVVDERSYSHRLADLDPDIDARREMLEQQANDAVQSLEMTATDASVTFHTAVEHGIPHETILDYAEQHDIDLLSMGTHGRTGLDRVLLGSVTERVIRTSDHPVLTSRTEPDDRLKYDRILIPTDGSEAASAAINHGIAIAERYDATIHILSVVDLGAITGTYEMGPSISDLLDTLGEECEHAVAEVAAKCRDRDVDVVTSVDQGTPSKAIQEYISDAGIDLVAMGTHGRTGLERYLIGSVTARVVRTSSAPVLTVREPREV
ncbi:universal stress protein [Halocatena marina]|uniref:Universal stress protein n=1 Tax=Halocatena marina TaxID=2934937 RepID=A0ABD5YPU6_9EURY|nr:universal stress protein [Halocatena marina]